MDKVLKVLCVTPSLLHGNKYVDAECVILSQNKKRERKILCMPIAEWNTLKKG